MFSDETKSEKIVFVSFIKPIILIIIVSLLLLSIPFIFFIIYIRKKTYVLELKVIQFAETIEYLFAVKIHQVKPKILKPLQQQVFCLDQNDHYQVAKVIRILKNHQQVQMNLVNILSQFSPA